MKAKQWTIYGAYGYTGRLLVEEAVKRGHRPILAGRDAAKLKKLASKYGLEFEVYSVEDREKLRRSAAKTDLIYNLAGPYNDTLEPIIGACLAEKTNYFDLTGDIKMYEKMFEYDKAARKAGVALISGVGFDVVATECLAKYVSDKVGGAETLEVGMLAVTNPSAGTFKQTMEILPKGSARFSNGKLERIPLGDGAKKLNFGVGEYKSIPIPVGELISARRSTGADNIAIYLAMDKAVSIIAKPLLKALGAGASLDFGKKALQKIGDIVMSGPSKEQNLKTKAYARATAVSKSGKTASALLITPEAYYFTVLAGINAVGQIFIGKPKGALTPSQAFGADFPLSVERVERIDFD